MTMSLLLFVSGLLCAQTRRQKIKVDQRTAQTDHEEVVKRVWKEHDSNLASSSSLTPDVYNAVKRLKKEDDIEKKFWEEVGKIDQNAPLGEELIQVGESVLGTTLGAVNPVLGLAWSVFTSMFEKTETDPTEGLLNDIFERTQRMIDGSLQEFWLDMVEDNVENIGDQMQEADLHQSETLWRNVEQEFMNERKNVFSACWDDLEEAHASRQIATAECDDWRIWTGGNKALLLELKFTELMMATHLELLRFGLYSHLNDTALRASRLTWEHALRWHQYKSVFRGTTGTTTLLFTQGTPSRREPGPCQAILGVDADTGKTFDEIDPQCADLVKQNGYNTNFPCLHTRYGEDSDCPTGCNPAQDMVDGCKDTAIPAIKQQTEDVKHEAEQVRGAVCNNIAKDFRTCHPYWSPRTHGQYLPSLPCVGNVNLKSYRGLYAQDDRGKVEFSWSRGGWETWTLEPIQDWDPLRVTRDHMMTFIKSHRGEFLEDRHGRVGLSWDMGGWQKWRLEPTGDGRVFIKSHRGEYLEDRDQKLSLHPDRLGWQKWDVLEASKNTRVCSFSQ